MAHPTNATRTGTGTGTGTKRILQEARELAKERNNAPAEGLAFDAAPLEDNLYEWHFTVRGPPGSVYEGGIYHGRLILPTEYPFRPPSILLLTPSGRFQINTKICLSITGYHEEHWQPAWGIRTALIGLQAFFLTEPKGAIGGLEVPEEERKRLARKSVGWVCERCCKSCRELVMVGGRRKAKEDEEEEEEEEDGRERRERLDRLLSVNSDQTPQSIPLSPVQVPLVETGVAPGGVGGSVDSQLALPQLPIHVRPPSPNEEDENENEHGQSLSMTMAEGTTTTTITNRERETESSTFTTPPTNIPIINNNLNLSTSPRLNNPNHDHQHNQETVHATNPTANERHVHHHHAHHAHHARPPVWMDRLIVVLLTAILALVVKRIA